MLQRIWAVTQKEFIHAFRDKRTLLMMISMPMFQLFLLGYALTMNVSHIPLIVADQSLDPASQAYVDALTASGFFDVVGYALNQAEVVRAIDEGRAQAGLVIPSDFAAQVERSSAQVLFLVDGSDLFTAQSAYNAALNIGQMHASDVLLAKITRSGWGAHLSNLQPLDVRVRVLYNPNMKDLWFIIPGMAAMILDTQSIAMTAAAVVRERETGTIEQILVTPIRSGELMLGKIAPNLVLAMVNMLTVVGVGVFWFGVPFQGNFWLFLGLSLIYVFCGLGLGILISTISQTQRQSQQLVGLVMLVSMMLGGSFLPRYTTPPLIQAVGDLFPLTHFVPIARGIITKGVGLEVLWKNSLILLVYAVVIMVLASRLFRQRLE